MCVIKGMAQRSSFTDIIQSEQPVLIDFFAEWCGPCKTLAPILKQFAGNYAEKVRVIKVDVDKNPSVAAQYQIQGVPTMILFKQGKPVWRQSGVVPLSMLMQEINKHI